MPDEKKISKFEHRVNKILEEDVNEVAEVLIKSMNKKKKNTSSSNNDENKEKK